MITFLPAIVVAAHCVAAEQPTRPPAGVGIMILAHGGDPDWNGEVDRLRARVDGVSPAEVAFGMADPRAMQAAVDRLAARGAKRVVAVPLFVETRSEVLDQVRYVLGMAEKPSKILEEGMKRMAAAGHAAGHHHAFSLERVHTSLPLALTSALDDDPLVSSILLERAQALSRDPAHETVILVAHGPVDDAALPAWMSMLAAHAANIKSRGSFRNVVFKVLRDDADPQVRAASVLELRAAVATAAGHAIVVPVLVARGGIEGKIPHDLQGLTFAWDARALLPHDGFDAWILRRAAQAH